MANLDEKNVQKIQRAKKKYRVDVRMPNGKRITKTFSRKFDAEQFKAKLKISKQRINETGVDLDRTIKFKDFVEIWFKDHIEGRKAVRTIAGYRSNFKNYILPILGELNINQISYYHAKQLENFIMKSGVKARTVNKVMMVFKTVLKRSY
ncbi:hypothetical protein [Bacteriovorax sp. Seq25_V]|uniref:hypothetical protein n=1 Tax=Bacteriovorax sp. Seq25_V TaxID=1201288 RepID=UPI00038A062A|nr:hypothetical protein [Bacteriovorax sp. Seq25_V]EQC47382.1 hypothetical protein M900_0865 [Bacteriovorax sp. Seq25_V]